MPLDTNLFYRSFLDFSQYHSIHSPIHQAFFFEFSVCSVEARRLSRYIVDFNHRQLLYTSRSIEILFSTPLDTSSIYRDAWINIFSRVNLVSFSLKHLDTSSFPLDPNPSFSPKSFFQPQFQPIPSFYSLVCGLNPSFSSFFMHFYTFRHLGFHIFGKFWGFCDFAINFRLGLLR